MATCATQGSKPAGDQDPAALLDAWKQDLEEKQTKSADSTTEANNFKQAVTNLEKSVAENKRLTAGADKTLPSLGDERDLLKLYYADKRTKVVAALGEDARQVEEIIHRDDAAITEQQGKLEEERQKLWKAKEDFASAQTDLNGLKGKYDGIKNQIKTLQEENQQAKALRAKVEAYDNEPSGNSRMYVLIHLADQLICGDVPIPEEYRARLNKAAHDLHKAEAKEKANKTVMENQTAVFTQLEQRLKELKDREKRQARLLEAAGSVKSPPAQAKPA